jgi:hypothetical protein
MNPNLCISCLDECQLSNQMLSARWSHDTARFVALVLTVRTVCLEDLTARSLLEVDRFGYIWIIWDIYVYFSDIFVYSFDKSGAVYLKSESLEMSWMLVFKDLFSKIIRNDQQIREFLDIHAISCYCYRKPSSILQTLLILSSPIRVKKYWANPTHLGTFSRSQSSRGRHMRPLSCYFTVGS